MPIRKAFSPYPVLTKGFLQLGPEVAMMFAPFGHTHPPPPVPPFLLAQKLSPKGIAGSDITSYRLYDAYRMARNFRGLKISRFSRINHEPRKFYPRKFQSHVLCIRSARCYLSASVVLSILCSVVSLWLSTGISSFGEI